MPAYINRWIGVSLTILAALVIGLVGCSRNDNDGKDVKKPGVQVQKDNSGKPIQAQLTSQHKPLLFKDAVILEPAPNGQHSPPNRTCNGKSVGKIFETISNELWDKTPLTNDDGKPVKYRAVMTTELGEIHIDLFGEVAPNHVRNFVCLAKTTYFDGMSFYYSLNDKVEENLAAYIETGCPNGTGEFGHGSIGYWLKPEVNELTHEEGVVGACLNGDPNSAGCRFYIAAAKMPQMDGYFTIFGKVTKGLDIVRTINNRAVYKDADESKYNHLKEPVLIRGVTIHQ